MLSHMAFFASYITYLTVSYMQYSELYICTHHIKDVVHEWNEGPFLLFSIPSEKQKQKEKEKRIS